MYSNYYPQSYTTKSHEISQKKKSYVLTEVMTEITNLSHKSKKKLLNEWDINNLRDKLLKNEVTFINESDDSKYQNFLLNSTSKNGSNDSKNQNFLLNSTSKNGSNDPKTQYSMLDNISNNESDDSKSQNHARKHHKRKNILKEDESPKKKESFYYNETNCRIMASQQPKFVSTF